MPEISEPIELINKRLIDLFGIDTVTTKAMWRVVWSEDQIEKRMTHYTKDGFYLLTPEVRELPKYRQWIENKFILERLTVVPEFGAEEVSVEKLSYEPIWVFEDGKGNPLPPRIDACKLIIDTVYAAEGKESLAKYVDDSQTPEKKALRIQKIEEELFGNESNVGDALAHNQAVIVPRNYDKES